ncbi:16935_t:CDS:1, partial [Racocetra fulgida]
DISGGQVVLEELCGALKVLCGIGIGVNELIVLIALLVVTKAVDTAILFVFEFLVISDTVDVGMIDTFEKEI